MKTISRIGVWSCCWVAGLAVSVQGAQFSIKPTRASGSYTITGNEIRLTSGQRVFLEVQLADWDPNFLRTYQAKIDAATYASGTKGMLAPAVLPCSGNNATGHAECAAAFAAGTKCNVPSGGGFICEAGFIDRVRNPSPPALPWVFFDVNIEVAVVAVDMSTPNFRYVAILNPGNAIPDDGNKKYGGDLVLDIPADATGTFTLRFEEGSNITFMADEESNEFVLDPSIPATIVVLCATNANCDDTDACTTDVCNANGTCSNTNNYNPATHCCNPADGVPVALSDGIACTQDLCDAETGQVTHPPAAAFTLCGNPANSQCDRPDSCDGAGGCNPRLESPGVACGSDIDTECNGADTCDGNGTCVTNLRAAGTDCGDPSDGVCDNPDTCNGFGSCLLNNEANGIPCSTDQFCIEGERCQSAVCTGGTPTDCADPFTCTTDSCNEDANQCDSSLDAGNCLIDGVCYLAGDVRPPIGMEPGNTCEECNPTLSTTSWSVRLDGSACNDGNACTGTGRPDIDDDTCTGGVCAGEPDLECNDDCEFAVPAIVGQNLSNNSSAGIDDGEASCQSDSNNDVWFEYTAACDGITFASTTGSALLPSNDTVLSVHSACPSLEGTFEVACDDDSGVALQSALNFSTTIGTSYLIRVAGFEDNKGSVVLNLRPVDDCLIETGGVPVCYREGDLNPANDCQACIPDLSTTEWSSSPEGSACGNGLDTECDSPDACDGAGVCEVNYKPDGIQCLDEESPVCTTELCNTCTKNLCQSGVCTHPPEEAGLACGSQFDDDCDNPNTCNGGGGCAENLEGAGHACGDQTDDQCDNPNICDGSGGCLVNFEIDGVACDDTDICTGDDVCATGICIGTPALVPPIVEGLGSRYLQVTPQDAFAAAPVSLRVTSPDWPCLVGYVDDEGRLVAAPSKVSKFPAEWGETLVQDPDIVPSTVYHVEAQCGVYRSAPGIGSTWLWGDLNNDGNVNAIDVVLIVDKFKELPGAISTEVADIHPCVPNGIINALDVVIEVDAVKEVPYFCSIPCP